MKRKRGYAPSLAAAMSRLQTRAVEIKEILSAIAGKTIVKVEDVSSDAVVMYAFTLDDGSIFMMEISNIALARLKEEPPK